MKPTIVLVGRPNVGKSTLFNRLTRTRDALVFDQPGLTRDRHYGHGKLGDRPYLVIDTGGFEPVADDGILLRMASQTLQAIDEADAAIFIVDARTGMTPQDKMIADRLRQVHYPVYVAVNKAEGVDESIATAEFFELALGKPWSISASHGEGVRTLIQKVLSTFPRVEALPEDLHPRFAIVGRPNVGKSTLVNAILGEERVITFDAPGTTRDSIYVNFARSNQHYTIIDTAGVRRRGKITDTVEKFSTIKTLRAIEDANVAVLVLDATQDISEQDARIAGFILEMGRAIVVAINKWELVSREQKDILKQTITRKLGFLDFAKFHYISAIEGKGVNTLFSSIDQAYAAAMVNISTPRLTRALQLALEQQQPPLSGRFRPKMRYAHQGGSNPPIVIVHGNSLESVPQTYWRYLERTFLEVFKLRGTPLRVQYKAQSNPFDIRPGREKEQKNYMGRRYVGKA